LSRFLRICNQSLQKVRKKAKNIFISKIQDGYKKTQNLSFEKMHQKKLLAKL
jgi:hypothetical protein